MDVQLTNPPLEGATLSHTVRPDVNRINVSLAGYNVQELFLEPLFL